MTDSLAAVRVDIDGPLTDMWRTVLLVAPKLLAFLAILLVGWLVATGLRKVVDQVLERVGFDRAVERGGIGRALQRTKYDASDILAKLVFYAVLLLTLQLAFGVWGPNPISDLIEGVVAWLPKAAVAIIIIVVAAAIASAVRDLVTAALGGLSYGRLLANLAAWFIIGLGAIAALNQVGIATTVTTPVLIAVLASIAGILIVGVGGGLVRPMQQRWDRWLGRLEVESEAIREQARAYAAGRRDSERAVQQAQVQQAPVMAGAGAPGPAYPAGAQPAPMPAGGGHPVGRPEYPQQMPADYPQDADRTRQIPVPGQADPTTYASHTATGSEATQVVPQPQPPQPQQGDWPTSPRER
ncbi:MAG TPA: hypothetical protein VFM55_25505 [Micromonosporaceae bacterium]|nr:hypothetical protein [Micromonosporaceae bacterium]